MRIEQLWIKAAILLTLWRGLPTTEGWAAKPAPGMHRIAFISAGPAGPNAPNVAALRSGLAALGYVEGQNLVIDFRWADNDISRLPALAAELLALKPSVVLTTAGPFAARAVLALSSTVPVVFISGDPVVEGLVPSFARPGANATGFAVLAIELDPKRLEILRQLLPQLKRIAIVWNPVYPGAEPNHQRTEAAASRLGMNPRSWKAGNAIELGQALSEIAGAKVDAIYVVADPVLGFERQRIVDFAAQHRLAGMYFWREFVTIGGLASYGTSLPGIYRRSADYIDRILKGTKPGDLPVQQPTTFELVINNATAKRLGIALPPSLRQRADEVID